jgi:hypothetical protein
MANEHAPMDVDENHVELFGAGEGPGLLGPGEGPPPHGAHMPDLGHIRSQLAELRNQPRFEQDDEKLPDGDNSTNDEILDGVWKLYRTHMARSGAPHHYPTFNELQQGITTNRANVANALGITPGRFDRIDINDVAKWILRKEDIVAPLRGDTDSRRHELNQAAMTVLRNAGHNAEEPIDPIARVKELNLLRGGRRKGKKLRRTTKKSRRKTKKSRRATKKSRRKTKKSRRKTKKTRRVN